MAKRFHVVPQPSGGWIVKRSSGSKSGAFTTKTDAVDAAKKIARKSGGELVIHGKNGRIVQADTYPKGFGSLKNKYVIRKGIDLTKPLFEQANKKPTSHR